MSFFNTNEKNTMEIIFKHLPESLKEGEKIECKKENNKLIVRVTVGNRWRSLGCYIENIHTELDLLKFCDTITTALELNRKSEYDQSMDVLKSRLEETVRNINNFKQTERYYYNSQKGDNPFSETIKALDDFNTKLSNLE